LPWAPPQMNGEQWSAAAWPIRTERDKTEADACTGQDKTDPAPPRTGHDEGRRRGGRRRGRRDDDGGATRRGRRAHRLSMRERERARGTSISLASDGQLAGRQRASCPARSATLSWATPNALDGAAPGSNRTIAGLVVAFEGDEKGAPDYTAHFRLHVELVIQANQAQRNKLDTAPCSRIQREEAELFVSQAKLNVYRMAWID
jgi:hypothetical protein